MADEEKALLLTNLGGQQGGGVLQTRSAEPPQNSLSSSPSNPQYGAASKPPLAPDDDLPTNVGSEEQLAGLPDVCLSGNKERPLRHVTEKGEVNHYHLQPMFYSVIFILLVELFERFAFYGINYTQTSFLTGKYDEDWNAGMSAVDASSYVSISTAVAYTMPFVGAFLADSLLGDYWSILFGSLFLYIPGLMLITLSTVPGLLGETFNKGALAFGLLFLWPAGTGVVKSIVNVFGARQFHPLLQSSLIESYYVKFYMCINVGALVGGILVPIVAQYDLTLAYTYPVAMLCIGVLLFVLGTPRYIRQSKTGDLFSNKKTVKTVPSGGDQSISLFTIFRISTLIIPFCIAYSQMATTFIVQGNVMKEAFGIIDAASMNNADAVAVLTFGWFVGAYFYPALARREIKIPTTYKFAIGSGFGALSIAWALVVEKKIHATYHENGGQVNILWQALAYVLIGVGEIFAVSAAYEVAFTAAPPEKKVLASAVNLFCVGGIPNVLCIILYQSCSDWFRNSHGKIKINSIEDYASAHVDNYFWVLLGISLFGVFINILPPVRDFVTSIEEKAIEMVKTPVMKKPKRHRRMTSFGRDSSGGDSSGGDSADEVEQSPMLRAKRHEAYLKYGSGPVLYKQGSMRAGPSVGKSQPKKSLKKSQMGKLYRTGPPKPNGPQVVLGAGGKPLTAGKLHRRQDSL
jgi:dipeptide/tripeptide permease